MNLQISALTPSSYSKRPVKPSMEIAFVPGEMAEKESLFEDISRLEIAERPGESISPKVER